MRLILAFSSCLLSFYFKCNIQLPLMRELYNILWKKSRDLYRFYYIFL
nr:MAG TPA: hypothetical protein [Caudoviricetes sp.]